MRGQVKGVRERSLIRRNGLIRKKGLIQIQGLIPHLFVKGLFVGLIRSLEK